MPFAEFDVFPRDVGSLPLVPHPSLVPQQLGLAAVDAGHCCSEHTQLHLHLENPNVQQDAVRIDDDSTGQPVFAVTRKPMSLHRQRTIVNASGTPVATLRTARVWRRRGVETTYQVFRGNAVRKTPCVAEFKVQRGWRLDMAFADLMTSTKCRLGCDGKAGDLEIWVQHVGKHTERFPIARMHSSLPGSPAGHTIEVTEGVDVLLVLIVCLGLNESASTR